MITTPDQREWALLGMNAGPDRHPPPATAVVITAKSAGRKVFGLATAGVRLA
ncbi:hypothetical protein [Streptomyces syringium]|uniref:hypothetical protein n=1 Tax=Streptomyces syringium TaxID=76729 RepID=UPI003437B2F2